jgi:hypothetical protein
MSSMLYYNVEANDASLLKSLRDESVSFDKRVVLQRIIKLADGTVTVDVTSPATVKAFFITTDKNIDVKINGAATALTVARTLLAEVAALTSLTITCSDATGASVEVVVWGNSAG